MKYFAYGSNLDGEQMRDRCPDSQLIGRARLLGYRLDFTRLSSKRKCGVADVVEDTEEEVWGLIYEITEKDRDCLDRKEGHPIYYRRCRVTVENDAGDKIEALTYEVVNKKPFIRPSPVYLNIIKNAAQEHNFPESYCNFLESVETKD